MSQTTISQFEAFFGERGQYYREFYIGIATDPKHALFSRHEVNEGTDAWIHTTSPLTSSIVRAIEKMFLNKGAKGGGGGGDEDTRHVYAYKIKPHTNENN